MEKFEQPLEDIFRDGIPQPVLRAFGPLFASLPGVQKAILQARACYSRQSDVARCVDYDTNLVTKYMQASEASFRMCPQQSSTLLKCIATEVGKAYFFCRDEEREWRTCLSDQTGLHWIPYANAPRGAPWSNGGQTEDFGEAEAQVLFIQHLWHRNAVDAGMRRRELEAGRERRKWLESKGGGDPHDSTTLQRPQAMPTIAPPGLSLSKS